MSQTTQTIALITGGSRGLGRSMAEHLARAGTDVVITWRSRQDEAEAVIRTVEAAGRRAAALQLDVGANATFLSSPHAWPRRSNAFGAAQNSMCW